jgi:hypothetical protein
VVVVGMIDLLAGCLPDLVLGDRAWDYRVGLGLRGREFDTSRGFCVVAFSMAKGTLVFGF